MTAAGPQRIATLWHLAWQESRVSCAVYRDGQGLQLRVESADAVIITERFDMQPRAVARAQALRESLKRRGWQEAPHDRTAAEAEDAPTA
jgi:hypothetical protein